MMNPPRAQTALRDFKPASLTQEADLQRVVLSESLMLARAARAEGVPMNGPRRLLARARHAGGGATLSKAGLAVNDGRRLI